jgi:hypothetical protein
MMKFAVFPLRGLVAAALLTCFANAAYGQYIVTGTATTSTQVKRFSTPTLAETASFFAFPGFTGGVRVAVGDVNGDGVGDIITGAGPGGAPQVQVFDGVTLASIRNFFAYPVGFTGGVYVAAGDINGDGSADIITGTDSGTPANVKVFDAITSAELRNILPFGSFSGGVRVAAGKVNSDGIADIIVGAGPGGSPLITVFDGLSGATIHNFLAYPAAFSGGVFVAAADVNLDLRADIITGAGPGGGSEVKKFSGVTAALIGSLLAPAFTGGTHVAAGRVNTDIIPDIIVAPGPGDAPLVQAFDGASNTLIHSFFAYTATFNGGVFVAAPLVVIPTAGEGSISGRVMTPDGRGLRNAEVILTDTTGNSLHVRSSSFGHYQFDDVELGAYIISVSSKQYRFSPRIITVSGALTDIDLTADCRELGAGSQSCD